MYLVIPTGQELTIPSGQELTAYNSWGNAAEISANQNRLTVRPLNRQRLKERNQPLTSADYPTFNEGCGGQITAAGHGDDKLSTFHDLDGHQCGCHACTVLYVVLVPFLANGSSFLLQARLYFQHPGSGLYHKNSRIISHMYLHSGLEASFPHGSIADSINLHSAMQFSGFLLYGN